MSVVQNISRRRTLQIVTSAVGMSLFSGTVTRSRSTIPAVHWRGIVMNAPAQLHLYGIDENRGRRAIHRAIMEARRLEQIFSLYHPDSAVRRLNQSGRLVAPPLELVELLNEARAISVATNGAFDVTMQPLWQLYAAHYSRFPQDSGGPPADALARARERVDYRALYIAAGEIAFARSGMAVSLNGIAQGHVTDRITDLLRAEGFASMTVDLGEARMTGAHPGGGPWQGTITDTATDHTALDHNRLGRISLAEGAVATSQPSGTVFEPTGRHHHLFDPRTGHSISHYRSVTVLARTATRADGLSTGFSILAPEQMRHAAKSFSEVRVLALKSDGAWLDTVG